MEIIKSQLQITISKTDMLNILTEAMQDETAGAAIKRVLNPFLANSFPQHPTFTQITLADTAEDGSTTVVLKQKPVKKASTEGTTEGEREETGTGEEPTTTEE